jgi:phosphonate transport system permease protein
MNEARAFTPVLDEQYEQCLAEWRRKRSVVRYLVVFGVIALAAGSFGSAGGFTRGQYGSAAATVVTLLRDSIPPDFSRCPSWIRPIMDTVLMGVAGTLLSTLVAVPLGLLGARTLCPIAVTTPIHMLLNVLRAIPSLVWGILFVAAFGFGSLAGVFALAAHSTGMLGKFFTELTEHVEPGPLQALRSEGVSSLGVARFGILPQVLPRMADVSLYRFEHNIREATTLGAVGAGGIGLEIVTAFHLFEYREAFALLLVILLLVTVIDALGAKLRRVFLGGIVS